MLSILGIVKQKLTSGKEVPVADMEAMADFLRTFVDKCHHGKEENYLFPKLISAGIPNEGGPIGVMLAEHVKGRVLIKGLADGIEKYKKGDPDGKKEITDAITGYDELLGSHILKEGNVLFRMADMKLGESEQDELYEKFEEFEEQVIGRSTHEQFHRLLKRLSETYLK